MVWGHLLGHEQPTSGYFPFKEKWIPTAAINTSSSSARGGASGTPPPSVLEILPGWSCTGHVGNHSGHVCDLRVILKRAFHGRPPHSPVHTFFTVSSQMTASLHQSLPTTVRISSDHGWEQHKSMDINRYLERSPAMQPFKKIRSGSEGLWPHWLWGLTVYSSRNESPFTSAES